MNKPAWIVEAQKYIGKAEKTGKNDHHLLDKAWHRYNLGWLIGQPWCGLFVAFCVDFAGHKPPKYFYRAKDWLNWGEAIFSPCYGCVVVFDRVGGGHVGFVVGMDNKGRIMVLGGNQSNKVSIAPFDTKRVVGYRVPKGYNVKDYPLSTQVAVGGSSENEA